MEVKQWKLVVLGAAFKRTPDGVRILTQRRKVQNQYQSYDPLYDQTWEGMGERMEPGEDVIAALIRGFAEECGHPQFQPIAIRGQEKITWWTTGKQDRYQCLEPFCFIHSMGPPQPWSGPAFIVEVASDFEPDLAEADGEADDFRWWDPAELQKALEEEPGRFMGLHIAVLHKLAAMLLSSEEDFS